MTDKAITAMTVARFMNMPYPSGDVLLDTSIHDAFEAFNDATGWDASVETAKRTYFDIFESPVLHPASIKDFEGNTIDVFATTSHIIAMCIYLITPYDLDIIKSILHENLGYTFQEDFDDDTTDAESIGEYITRKAQEAYDKNVIPELCKKADELRRELYKVRDQIRTLKAKRGSAL